MHLQHSKHCKKHKSKKLFELNVRFVHILVGVQIYSAHEEKEFRFILPSEPSEKILMPSETNICSL